MVIIKTQNLIKKFKDMLAIDSVNLEIEEGECFGLLGDVIAGEVLLFSFLWR